MILIIIHYYLDWTVKFQIKIVINEISFYLFDTVTTFDIVHIDPKISSLVKIILGKNLIFKGKISIEK